MEWRAFFFVLFFFFFKRGVVFIHEGFFFGFIVCVLYTWGCFRAGEGGGNGRGRGLESFSSSYLFIFFFEEENKYFIIFLNKRGVFDMI